jgi:type I restriction enzyme M protein
MALATTQDFTTKTKELIDTLKSVCANYGLGNDGNEFKIITQTFLYKFMNDKFAHEVKQALSKSDSHLKGDCHFDNWEQEVGGFTDSEYQMLLYGISPEVPKLKREHYLSYLFNRQSDGQFAKLFDDTLRDIAIFNNDIFSVKTDSGAKIILFDELSNYITDSSKRDAFCRALINPLVNFSFEGVFEQKFDFFATIFEYLIKDYNKDGGGKYAEYYTPHAVAKIMAAILVTEKVKNVTAYDPAAGSGSLLMSLAHQIGEDRCAIYSQDISQKSSGMLRLNLILNNLVHSIQNIIQGNTLLAPYHKKGGKLMTFDFIVSNPPFKLDFSDFSADLDTKANHARFFAGIPNVPNKDKDKMAIYLVFIQHIMFSLSAKGKAAIVVPTGFLTAQSGIEKKIREKLVEEKMLRGVVSMPSNIFATTGTNVSILFLDKANTKGEIVLMDASKLGTTVKDGKNQKTLLSADEEQRIISTFNLHQATADFSVSVSYEQIREKNYSFSAGQYFDVKIEYTDLTPKQFAEKMNTYKENLDSLFAESQKLEKEIKKQLGGLKYE